ncbi:hypothetical protein REH65_18355 [Saccharopolyspora sp. ID03-671]|uniref:hypothetical protein n=1 Tax=Saccharopolyspora sp. ID03-671 TaxID=3073066 RepID=UPI00325080E2
MRRFTTVLAGAALAGLALTTAPVANATTAVPDAGSAPITATAAQGVPLTVDRPVVHPGEQLRIHVEHGQEALSWVSSGAFVRDSDHPMGADEGVAHLVRASDGSTDLIATIADVAPGQYQVHGRAGGGPVPGVVITVE